jgi:hypothetical protein
MRITKIRLRNFKRFTDLTIKDILETARLVVIVGPNGSGKSSLFDALLHWYKYRAFRSWTSDELYYRKQSDDEFDWGDAVQVTLAQNAQPHKGCLYVRTAYRNDPDFTVDGLKRPRAPTEAVKIQRIIENDQTVAENFQRLIYDTIAGVYDPSNDEKSVVKLREELIGGVRASMEAVFGDLLLNNISDPLGAGTFYFEKGSVKSYHYKNLSGGEKSAFDLLLDMHIKKRYFRDAIYCIDELETHLHTRVQGALLKELMNILPEESQLWTTTHSLGILRAAQELSATNPGSVCVIDFDGVNPDIPHELVPSSLGRVSWEKLLSIALDDLTDRLAPSIIVVCEGSSIGSRRKDFDAEIYNRIFNPEVPDVLFVSGGSSGQVAGTSISASHTLSTILPKTLVVALCDRDDKSDDEVKEFEKCGNLVLPRRNLESFLFDDEVIQALVVREGKQDLLPDALAIKRRAIEESVNRGNRPDDLKSAAGNIYVELKRLLALQRCSNTTETFMRDTLAPLIKPPMRTYNELKETIIDRLYRYRAHTQ